MGTVYRRTGVQHALKTLQTRLKRARSRARELELKRAELEGEIHSAWEEVDEVQSEIDRLKAKTKGVIVSEHAIVRYMERVHGIDLEAIKREIVGCDPENLRPLDGLFPVDGHKVRIREGVVVTVITEEGQRE